MHSKINSGKYAQKCPSIYSETVLNRCVLENRPKPQPQPQQDDSHVSKTGLRDFFQVQI